MGKGWTALEVIPHYNLFSVMNNVLDTAGMVCIILMDKTCNTLSFYECSEKG